MVRLWARATSTVALAACATALLAGSPAWAQFSGRDGYAADGSYQFFVELTPYLWLPNLDATIGLKRPPGFDISIDRARPTVADLVSTLDGAFVGAGLFRYGPWSAELDVDWVSATAKKNFPPLLNVPPATLKVSDSLVYVTPGIGYQVISTDRISFDIRAGFSYFETNASAAFLQSRFGGANVSYDFVVPWLGFRADYYPSPSWRMELLASGTGWGVDSAWGWKTTASVSYLVTHWFDVTLGYGALGLDRNLSAARDGSSKALNLTAYGPVVALGFRF